MNIGDSASFTHTITESDVEKFAELSGDRNPLHMDDAYASRTPFKKRIVHGMFLGALASRLLGMHLPGERCLYIRQELSFHKPVFIGTEVTVTGVVKSVSSSTGIYEIMIEISGGGTKFASGPAYVKLL